ncbi:MAG: 16S rRNA (uracil(1498)-N(3))-methyltransferase [Gammaproteobacteria bacterium]|nr:16S rRNA (uracil(1498)-N(3))-methyltransferase [Gammaproteobacteria bacterium]
MRASRIHTVQPLATGVEVALDARAARYIGQVLRLRPGDHLTLFNGDGDDFDAELLVCSKRECRALLHDIIGSEPPTKLQIHLALGISRGERMDFAIQKSVELGVHSITPLSTERSVVQLRGDRLEQRAEHWRGVVVSACEQSGRNRLPTLSMPRTLADWLPDAGPGVMLYHEAGPSLAGLGAPQSSLTLLIGPEGGLSAAERALAEQSGFISVRMGPRVMRTETAPIAAIAAIQALWGDFR